MTAAKPIPDVIATLTDAQLDQLIRALAGVHVVLDDVAGQLARVLAEGMTGAGR